MGRLPARGRRPCGTGNVRVLAEAAGRECVGPEGGGCDEVGGGRRGLGVVGRGGGLGVRRGGSATWGGARRRSTATDGGDPSGTRTVRRTRARRRSFDAGLTPGLPSRASGCRPPDAGSPDGDSSRLRDSVPPAGWSVLGPSTAAARRLPGQPSQGALWLAGGADGPFCLRQGSTK